MNRPESVGVPPEGLGEFLLKHPTPDRVDERVPCELPVTRYAGSTTREMWAVYWHLDPESTRAWVVAVLSTRWGPYVVRTILSRELMDIDARGVVGGLLDTYLEASLTRPPQASRARGEDDG